MPGKKKTQRRRLQRLVGASPEITVERFTNWAGTQVVQPILACWPTTVEEVQAVIRGAKFLGLKVRAAGATHTWTPLYSDKGQVVMYLGKLERSDGPRIELKQGADDPNRKSVTLTASVTTREFLEFQISHGVCIPSNAILREVQMGGLVTPACHGVGWNAQTISDYVTHLSVIDSNGNRRNYSVNEDLNMMRAVQCSLGLWGIIVEITMKVDPMVIVETENRWMTMKDVFYDKKFLQELITKNWSVQIYWFPFTGMKAWEGFEALITKKVDCREWKPTEDDLWIRIVNKPEKVGDVVHDTHYDIMGFKNWIQAQGFQVVDGFISDYPQAAPLFLKSLAATIKGDFEGKITQPLPHAIHYIQHIADNPLHEMEWAFSLDADCSNLQKAVQATVALVHKEALAGRFPLNLPIEMRFIADSDAYMAPAICGNKAYGGSGHTVYIGALTVRDTPNYFNFCVKLADIWKRQKGARPHWCKEWASLPGINEFIRKAYSAQMPRFLDALAQSQADPGGMFFNKQLEAIFYPNGHPGRPKGQERRKKAGGKAGAERESRFCDIL